MSNTTDPSAQAVHGTNPQFLIEKITRLKIYNSPYWKEECFGLTAATIIDKAVALKSIGGTYGGNNKPSKFLCLLLKALQLQPDHDIILEFIRNDDFKYLRALGAIYLRLTGKAEEIYRYLEPLYNDYRPMVFRNASGWSVTHMDEFIDSLLREELVCDIALPFIMKRLKLEESDILPPRHSAMEEELAELERLEQEEGNDDDDDDDQELNGDVDTSAAPNNADKEDRGIKTNAVDRSNSFDHIKVIETTNNLSTELNRGESIDVLDSDNSRKGRNFPLSEEKEDKDHYDRSQNRCSRSRSNSRRRDNSKRDRKDDKGFHRAKRRSESRDRQHHRRNSDEQGRDSDKRYAMSKDEHYRRREDRAHRDSRSPSRSRSPSEDSRDRRHRHKSDKRRHKKDRKHRRHRRSRERSDSYSSESEYSTNEDRRSSRKSHRSKYSDRREESRDRTHEKRRRDEDADVSSDRNKKMRKDEENLEEFQAFSSRQESSTKKTGGEKAFDRIFGKKKVDSKPNSGDRSGRGGASNADQVAGKVIVNDKGEKFVITASEGTVEYWNQMREALGLKKLKP